MWLHYFRFQWQQESFNAVEQLFICICLRSNVNFFVELRAQETHSTTYATFCCQSQVHCMEMDFYTAFHCSTFNHQYVIKQKNKEQNLPLCPSDLLSSAFHIDLCCNTLAVGPVFARSILQSESLRVLYLLTQLRAVAAAAGPDVTVWFTVMGATTTPIVPLTLSRACFESRHQVNHSSRLPEGHIIKVTSSICIFNSQIFCHVKSRQLINKTL